MITIQQLKEKIALLNDEKLLDQFDLYNRFQLNQINEIIYKRIKKLISCSRHEQTTVSKLIDKLISKYIEDNNYDIEKIFNDNLQVKQEMLDSLIDYKFEDIKQINY